MLALGRLKKFVTRKHFVLFGIVLAAGMSMITVGTLMDTGALSASANPVIGQYLIIQGIVLVVLGLVGILLWWPTFDTGTDI